MSRKTLRSHLKKVLKNSKKILGALLLVFAFVFATHVSAQNVNINAQVLVAPSSTKNDFDFSAVDANSAATSTGQGRVLGAQSQRSAPTPKKLNIILWILIINPLVLI